MTVKFSFDHGWRGRPWGVPKAQPDIWTQSDEMGTSSISQPDTERQAVRFENARNLITTGLCLDVRFIPPKTGKTPQGHLWVPFKT